jgi:hypothetical protein
VGSCAAITSLHDGLRLVHIRQETSPHALLISAHSLEAPCICRRMDRLHVYRRPWKW